ncbi:MAG: hypothetical protein AB1941_16015 [Gemmatimonadota bacterium]
MAGLRTVLPDALPAPAGEAVLAGLAATLVASLLLGLRLSRRQAGAGELRDVLAARPTKSGERAPD